MNQYYNLKTKEITSKKNSKALRFLHHTVIGRIILKVLTLPFFSKVFSLIPNSRISRIYIKRFIKQNNINMDEYEQVKFKTFNDFFTRKIKSGAREISINKNDLIAPADSKLTVYKIDSNTKLEIKNSIYTIESIIQDQEVAKAFQDGTCLVFRLCVDDYHRYIFIDDGKIENTKSIKGRLHTVNPIALERYPVFSENHRVISLLDTNNFGEMLYIEVGALNIGKVHNHDVKTFKKGEEKGYFSFGASTIILMFKKDQVIIDDIFIQNTQKNIETIIKQGTIIGHKNSTKN